jgi:hypothetical protein
MVEGNNQEDAQIGGCRPCVETKQDEVLHVLGPYTVIDPRTVMVHLPK